MLSTLAITVPGQCQIVGSGLGLRGDRVTVVAATAWDPDGSGPRPSTLAIAGAAPSASGIPSHVLDGKVATFDIVTGMVQPIGAVAGAVRDLAELANGNLLAAGEFTAVDGAPLSFLARYDGTAWSALGAAPNGAVDRVLVLGNGDLIIGGRFTAIGGQPMARLARWNGTTWSALGGGVDGAVRTLALGASGELIVGGDFTVAGSAPASHIASWDGTSWSALGAGTDAPVSSVTLLPNGHLAVAGFFLHAGGITAQYIADWNGTSWSQLGGNATSFVLDSVLLPNGSLLVNGQFTQIGGQPIVGSAIWNGTSWSAPTVPINAKVPATLPGGQQLLWPYVQTGSGYAIVGQGWNGGMYGADVDSHGNLYVTGTFTDVLGVPAVHVARYDGTTWSALGAGIPTSPGGVYSMCVDANDELFCGGYLSLATGAPGDFIVHWNGSTWTAVGGGTNGRVDALVPRVGGGVIAGGSFTMAGSVAAGGIASWDGTAWSALGNVAGTCNGLGRLANGDLIAVGYFTTPASRVIRWDGTTWTALPTFDGAVYCVAGLPDGSFVVGGLFTTAGANPASRIARWDGAAWSALGAGVNSAVTSMFVLPDGDVLTTDFLPGVGYGAVRWDGTAWGPFAGVLGPALDYAMMPDGRLAAVGRMIEAGGATVDSFAFLSSSCPAAAVTLPSGCNTLSLTAAARGLPWIGATHRIDGTGFATGSLGAALIGLQSPAIALSTLHPSGLPGCLLLASPDAMVLTMPTAGAASYDLVIPPIAAFIGVQLFEQFIEVPFQGGQLLGIGSSNGLRLTIGAL